MNTKWAALLLVPALAVSAGALARGQTNQDQDRHDSRSNSQRDRSVQHHEWRNRVSGDNKKQDQWQPSRNRQPVVHRPDPSPPPQRGGGHGRDPNPHSGGQGGGEHGGGDHGHGHGEGGEHGGGDYGHGWDHDRPHGGWHGQREDWHGHVYWRADIRLFPRYDWDTWRHGYWYHGWYGHRWGWWWLAGGIWFYYPAPIYPYPSPYVPGGVTVIDNTPSSPPPAAPAQAPTVQYWYHCKAPDGYYPYVSQCPGGWTKVPVTPPGTSQTTAAPGGR